MKPVDFLAGVAVGLLLSVPSWVVILSNSHFWRKRYSTVCEVLGEVVSERDYLEANQQRPQPIDPEDESESDDYRGG